MATTEAVAAREMIHERPPAQSARYGIVAISLLTAAAVLIQGFHPYAEDGGIYVPGILKILHPDLYPTMTGFVIVQTRFSLFAPLMAGIIRITHCSVVTCLFCVYIASIWVMMYAAWRTLSCCYRQHEAVYGGMTVMAMCLSMPIAGSSLLLMDPYVTARSFSTPCTLLSIAGALEFLADLRLYGRVRRGSIFVCLTALIVAAAMHPLMACYAAGCILLLGCAMIRDARARVAAFSAVAVLSMAVASALYVLAPSEPAGYAQVAQSRNYWFLANWHWYELLGLLAPLVLLQFASLKRRNMREPAKWLAQMAVAAGTIGCIVSLLFAHEVSRSYIVAMLQPLRIFLVVYIVLLVVAGAEIGRRLLCGVAWRWAVLASVLGGLLFFVQWQSFPHSAHLELPWAGIHSDWEQGFRWVRENTEKNAVVALDANYILSSGEDTQNFRAIAERSMLPDYAKDGGIASIAPSLTPEWLYGERIQRGLDQESDAVRKSKLSSLHIEWLVLPANAKTSFPCPYQNRSMKVCSIP